MRHRIYIVVLMLCFLSTGFSQVMPSNVATILTPPSPILLADYYSIGSTSLQATLNFTDFSEPSWDIRLRVTIESADVKLQTSDNFRPATPITITPGVPLIVSGPDFYEYLEVNNLELQGITAATLNQSGKLPEGLYEFCVEILDYETGIPLSLPGCATTYLFNEPPPVILKPECESVVLPTDPQNIFMEWQIAGGASPTISMNSLYKMYVYEVMDDDVDPYFAVQNNNALLVYESDFAAQLSKTLDFTTTILEAGHKYCWRVRAVDEDEQNIYSNDGYSEWCWFYYGYPENGVLEVNQPADEYVYSRNEQMIFDWETSDAAVAGQSFNYTIQFYEMEDGQSAEEAVENNLVWYEETLPLTTSVNGANYILAEEVESGKRIAWRVIADSDGQHVATSTAQIFYPPSLVEQFYAGNTIIPIVSLNNSDLTNLSGTCRIPLSADEDDYVEVEFDGITLEEELGEYILTSGEILFTIDDKDPIELEPAYQENGVAYLNYLQGKATVAGVSIQGEIEWPLPHAVNAADQGSIVTSPEWFTVNNSYELNGSARLTADNWFELLDPGNFVLDFDEQSDIQLSANVYSLRLIGNVFANENVTTNNGEQYGFGFSQQEQLYYFEVDNLLSSATNYMVPVQGFNLGIMPVSAIVDFSETESPGKLSGDIGWKGIYFPDFKVRLFSSDFDETNQLFNPEITDYMEDQSGDFEYWVNALGLHLEYTWTQEDVDGLTFNDFATDISGTFSIDESTVSNSTLKGAIKIPFIDQEDEFTFTIPVENSGLQDGYLDEDITNREVVFNPFGGENRVDITLNRAVFAENNRLELEINAEIPALNATIEGISDFRAYGNGYIGVGEVNGSLALDTQVEGEYNGFAIFIQEVGASLSGGNYAFSYVAAIDLGDDVTGDDGPPLMAVSSVESAGEGVGDDNTNVPEPSIEVPEEAEGSNEITSVDMYIACDNAIVELEGYLNLTQNDPDWGTCFRGGINGTIKIPSEVDMGANMILGVVDNLDYWYFDAYFNDTEGMGISVFNTFNLVAMEGRIYRHMSKDEESSEYVVDEDIDFGAGLYMQIIDNGGGKLFQADIGAEVEVTGSDFIVQMEGDMSMINETSRSSAGGSAISAVGTELVDEVIDAIGPISLEFNVGGGTLKVTAEGTTAGSLDYSKGDLGVGFSADLGSVPAIGFGYANGSDNFDFNASADGEFGLGLGIDGKNISMGLSGSSSGYFNLEYDDVRFNTEVNRDEKTGSLDFAFGDKSLGFGVEADGGYFNVALDEQKSFSTGFNASGSAYLGLEYDGNSFNIEGDKTAGSGSLALNIDGVEMSTSVNTQEKSAEFSMTTSSFSIGVSGQSGVGGSFNYQQGSQAYSLEADLQSQSASVEVQPDGSSRYFMGIENGETYSVAFEKGNTAVSSSYGPDNKEITFSTGVVSANAGKAGDKYTLGFGYDGHNFQISKENSDKEFIYESEFAKVTVNQTSIFIDDLNGGEILLDANGLTMNAQVVSNAVAAAGGIDTTIQIGSANVNLYAQGTEYRATFSASDNSVSFATNNFSDLTVGLELDGNSISASSDGSDYDIRFNDYRAALISNELILEGGSDKTLSVSSTGFAVNYEEYAVAIESADGEESLSLSKGDESFMINRKGFAIELNGQRYAINEEEYLHVDIDESRYIEVTDNGALYHDNGNELAIGGDENYLRVTTDGRTIALTQDESLKYTQDNYSAELRKDLSIEISDGERTLGLFGDEHVISYTQGDYSFGIRGGSANKPGADFTVGQTTIFVEGERNSDVSVGVSNTDFGSITFTCDSDKNLNAIYAYDDRELILRAGEQGISFEDSDDEQEAASADFLEGSAEAPEMDGPQYLGDDLTASSNGKAVGSVSIYYNSAEQHFIGNAAVASTVPPCVDGALAIEVTPDSWSFQLGTENDMVEVYPTCSGFGGGGWLGLTPDEIDVGVFVGWSASASVKIGGDFCGAKLKANTEAELGVRANADLDPFKINEAGVWVRVYAGIGVDYWCSGASGDLTIAEAEISGTLMCYFEDKTRVEGELEGYVNILDLVEADFEMSFSTTL